MIDILALRKLCITVAGVDIGLLKMHQSQGAVLEARRFLRSLQEQYPDSKEIVEAEIIRNFNNNLNNKRRRKYLAELLSQAFPLDDAHKEMRKISGKVYHELRSKLVGIEDYDEETRKKIEENWRREYSSNGGIYDILQGKESNPQENLNQPQLAAAAARKQRR